MLSYLQVTLKYRTSEKASLGTLIAALISSNNGLVALHLTSLLLSSLLSVFW